MNDVWVQFLVVVVIFETAKPHIWDGDVRQRGALYLRMGLVLVVAAAVTVVLDRMATSLHPGHLNLAAVLLRCVATAAVWAVVAPLLLRQRANVTDGPV